MKGNHRKLFIKLLLVDISNLRKYKSLGIASYVTYVGFVVLQILINILLMLATNAAVAHQFETAVFYAVLFLSALFAVGVINFLGEFVTDLYKQRIYLDLAQRILENNVKSPRDAGEVLGRISADLENTVYAIVTPLWLIFVSGRLVALFAVSYSISQVAVYIVPFALVYGVLFWRYGPRLMVARSEERSAYSTWFQRLKEALEGALSLHRVGVFKTPTPYLQATQMYYSKFKGYTLYNRFVTHLFDIPTLVGPNLIFVLALIDAVQGRGDIGGAIALRSLLMAFFEPTAHFVITVSSYYTFAASYLRVEPYLKAEERGVRRAPLARLRDAVFSYNGRPVLHVEELSVAPGDFVWVRGPSGAGKSTLGKAICGLVAPSSGEAEAAEGCIYVGVDDYIFDATVYENIDLWEGRPRGEVERAAALAEVDFPLDKRCGEKGSELSEGQRQRVLVARALLRRPKVLVLDEVTSGVPVEVEERILKNVREAADAVVVISHRSTAAKYANKIVEVVNGRAVVVSPH